MVVMLQREILVRHRKIERNPIMNDIDRAGE
jgi:hypothetical protein